MGRGKSRRNKELIEASREILEEIQPATVRAVCYRLFIERRLIPSMEKKNTNRVGRQLVYAREQGIIPWEHIVDETREAEGFAGFEDPEEFMEWAKQSFRRDHWRTQACRVEVWSEKGTVRGTLGPVLEEFGVLFRVNHGYASATALREVVDQHGLAGGDRRNRARHLVILYVGDWDPSGLHMSEIDIPRRLLEFVFWPGWLEEERQKEWAHRPEELRAALLVYAGVDLRRLALTEEDVADHGLPSFAADTKRGDTRWRWYRKNYGRRCWELDALSPVILRERVEQAIRAEIDFPAWERCSRNEALEQKTLGTYFESWRRSISRLGSK